MSAIINPRDILMQGTPVRLLPISLPTNVVIPGIDGIEPNLDAPPMPTGFSAVASLSNLNFLTSPPTFSQGHGYARTKIYGKVRAAGDPLPVFADAVNITSFVGQVFSHPTRPSLTWHLWATWVSRDGIESQPAGGPNGQVATTSEDVERLVAAMTGPGQPFTVVNTPTTLSDGTVVPAGTYTSDAYMSRFVAARGNIGLLAVDDARMASVSATKLVTGTVQVGVSISSSTYVPGSQGWSINGQGQAEFSGVVVRGTIVATAGLIGGNTITATGVYSPNFQSGSTGWGIDSSGIAQFNSVQIRGAIKGGSFVDYAWPAGAGTGFYLGPGGLLLGNFNLGRYVQITDAGNFYAPGFSIENGVMTISQANVINTLNIAGEAVTVPRAGRMASPTGVNGVIVTLPVANFGSGAVMLTVFAAGLPGRTAAAGDTDGTTYPNTYYVLRNGVAITSFPGGVVSIFLDTPGGAAIYQVSVDHGAGVNESGETTYCVMSALGCKR